METLEAKTRDMSIKAKKLRREGLTTGSICGKQLEHSISLTMDENKVAQFMLDHHVGSKAVVDVDGTKYNTVIKSADHDILNGKFIDVTFQQLVADEKIKSQAEIVFVNESATTGFITRNLTEIEYRAYPKDMFDTIEIDISKYPIGTNLTVGDLDIAKNENIDILTALDSSVLHIAEHQHMNAEDEAMIEAEEEAAAEE